MKRTSPLIRRGSDIDFDSAMTPMIDVVFLLLVFFVWTASFQIVEQILPSNMTAQIGSEQVEQDVDPPPQDDFDDIVVRIGWNGELPTWKINDESVDSLAAIRTRLETISGIQIDAVVILHPDPVVPLGIVIGAYDVAKVVGFEKVSFAVNPQGGP